MPRFATEASRWSAVQSREQSADGKFVYCVKTTKIYCRPTCKARLARRANVIFHDGSYAAEAAGFRPCLRCKPELDRHDPQTDVIAKACSTMRLNASLRQETSLQSLASEAGLTESHFHRVFKKVMGMTPKAYALELWAKDSSEEELCYSPFENLTPLLDHHSSSVSSSGTYPLTPSVTTTTNVVTALPFGWEITLPSSEVELQPTPKETPPPRQSDLEFTIQPWASGHVLIAVANDSVCAIDVAGSYDDLVARLQRRFPVTHLLGSDWARSDHSPFQTPNQLLFQSVMEALENPSGKTLNLSPDVFDNHG